MIQPMRLIDTHTHLDFTDSDAARTELLARCRALGVERLVVLGVHQGNWQRLWELVQGDTGLYAAFGLHPLLSILGGVLVLWIGLRVLGERVDDGLPEPDAVPPE